MSADKISLALGGAKKPSKPAATNGVKRSHAALRDQDEEESTFGQTQVVSHFDRAAGGAIDEAKTTKEAQPLIITPRANRDWKEASKRNKRQRSAKLGHPGGGFANGQEAATAGVQPTEPAFGLNVPKSKQHNGQEISNGHSADDDEEEAPARVTNEDTPMPDKTDEERAIDALLGREEKSQLVLPALTEEEAFARDYKDAPDMASLEDYDRVPVEQFGAAFLRGMGWKEGEGIGNQRGKKVEKSKIPERRPALLGIGAKEEAAVAQELGTWGKAAKDRKGAVQVYNPVLLRDKNTGELFTEEEAERKKARDEREKYEREFEAEERRKEKERRRRDRDEDERARQDDRRRDRRREGDDERDRRKYDKDDDYYRRREKDKRRRERERDDEHYDRERSRRHDSDRERRRDDRR